MAPVWVIGPVEVIVSVPLPTLDAPSFVAAALVSATLFAPLLSSATAPVQLVGLGQRDRVRPGVEGGGAGRPPPG